MSARRLSTGITGLDQMLGGGLLPESATLLRGAPGTGKTTIAFQFLREGALHGEPGLLISFEEFPESLYRDASSLGWELKDLEAAGTLHLMFTSPEVVLTSLQNEGSPLLELLRSRGVRRVVLDSVTHFTRVAQGDQALRSAYATVVNGLKREATTALLIGEETPADTRTPDKGRLGFIVDNLILLRYLEIESQVQRAMVVLKVRGSAHSRDIRRYEIQPGGIVVGERFEGREGLLSGIAQRRLISSVR